MEELKLTKKQAFDIWRQLTQSKTSGFGAVMTRLFYMFGGSDYLYYRKWVKNSVFNK